MGQTVGGNTGTEQPAECLARNRGWASPRFLTFKQALEAGGNVRKGEHGTKVYFVKQLQIRDDDGADAETRLVPMLREYTVFNVDQCDGLPDGFRAGKPMRVRNPDTRDALADDFLRSTGADIREGHGEAQKWEIAQTFDKGAYCSKCDGESRIEERPAVSAPSAVR